MSACSCRVLDRANALRSAAEHWVVEWVIPSGAAGAVVVAAWLVEAKQRVVGNMAPVLALLFTPIFALMLALAAVVYASTGLGGAFDRDLLTIFDALLLVVLERWQTSYLPALALWAAAVVVVLPPLFGFS